LTDRCAYAELSFSLSCSLAPFFPTPPLKFFPFRSHTSVIDYLPGSLKCPLFSSQQPQPSSLPFVSLNSVPLGPSKAALLYIQTPPARWVLLKVPPFTGLSGFFDVVLCLPTPPAVMPLRQSLPSIFSSEAGAFIANNGLIAPLFFWLYLKVFPPYLRFETFPEPLLSWPFSAHPLFPFFLRDHSSPLCFSDSDEFLIFFSSLPQPSL